MNQIPEFCNPANITHIGDECIILPNNMTEDCIVGLANETAAYIIREIDGVKTIGGITDSVCNQYEVEKCEAYEFVLEFINTLVESGLCKWRVEP